MSNIRNIRLSGECRLRFSNRICLKLVDKGYQMLFHITAKHSWETCRGRQRAESSEDIFPPSEVNKWIEGNDKVKVLLAGGHQTAHKFFAFVEADDYLAVQELMRPLIHVGDVDVLPVNDMITIRKAAGDWGK